MRLQKCPKPEALLELLTIPRELSFRERALLRSHALFCRSCQEKLKGIKQNWENYSNPEPDITPSLLRVYNRLQNDETLIFQGWKLGQKPKPNRNIIHWLFEEGWAMRGAVTTAAAAVIIFTVVTFMQPESPSPEPRFASTEVAEEVPYMQFRFKDKNNVQVHYVQPELLQTIEFETASGE